MHETVLLEAVVLLGAGLAMVMLFRRFGLGAVLGYLVGGAVDHALFAERLPSPTFGGGGLLWASLTLALLTVPVVIVATEEALVAVPRGIREGSIACVASSS